MNKRQNYSRDFKIEAVRLLELGDVSAAQLARDLGVARPKLYLWRDQFAAKGEKAFRGASRTLRSANAPETAEDENRRLKRELEEMREERDILEKAAAYFARQLP